MPVYESIKNADNKIVISAANKDSVVFGWDEVLETLAAKVKAGAINVAIDGWYGINYEKIANRSPFELSGGQMRRVAIAGVLAMEPKILILDEPTAVLTPQETQKLFAVLRTMRDMGKSIIIITHKMHEVLSISDRVAVLRKGEHIATVKTSETNENELTEMMVGKKVDININRRIGIYCSLIYYSKIQINRVIFCEKI